MLRRSADPAGADVARAVPGGAQARDPHGRPGMRGVDEAARPDVEAHMAESVEEDEVARPERGPRDAPPHTEVGVGAVRQIEAEVAEDVADEPGAVEAAARRVAAV